MEQQETTGGRAKVAENTAAAAHRRDHAHVNGEARCHPHTVEVVHLGEQAMAICHDCRSDSGYLPHRRAEAVAVEHRRRTRSGDVALQESAAG